MPCSGLRSRSPRPRSEPCRVHRILTEPVYPGRATHAVPDLSGLLRDHAAVAYRAEAERSACRHALLRMRPVRFCQVRGHRAGLGSAKAGLDVTALTQGKSPIAVCRDI